MTARPPLSSQTRSDSTSLGNSVRLPPATITTEASFGMFSLSRSESGSTAIPSFLRLAAARA